MTSSSRGPAGPRPATASPRRGTLHTVTERNSEVGSSESEDAPAGRQDGRGAPGTRKSAFTDRDRWAGWLDRVQAYLIPPSVLTQPPPAVSALAAYAKDGAWTGRRSGPVRAVGIWWFRLVALPYTTVCRYGEWIAQRPGRAVTVAVFVKVMASTTWGSWAVEHLFTPAGRAAVWLFL